MKSVRRKSWIFFVFLGAYLVVSPFLGLPATFKSGIYVILGGISMWLSLIAPTNEEVEVPIIK